MESKYSIDERLSKTTTMSDTISILPNEILSEILSHLTTRQVVALSVLSKRWNKIWTLVPNLDLHDWLQKSNSESPLIETSFTTFLDNFLLLNRVSSMRKICFPRWNIAVSSRVKAWINNIVTRDAEDFELGFSTRYLADNINQIHGVYVLPDTFFTSKNLVQLSLRNVVLKIPESVCFPCLKTAWFSSVQFLDDASMKNLLLGCPVIQDLSMHREVWDNVIILYICSSTLLYLTLYNQQCTKYFRSKIAIDAPNLRCLKLIETVGADYDIVHLSNLVQVNVDVGRQMYPPDTNLEVFNGRLLKLLSKISHVGKMSVGPSTMHSLTYILLDNVPMFNDLTRMEVKVCYRGWPFLLPLLHCAPNLVTFVLEKEDKFHICSGLYRPINVPQCFSSSLEYVVIRNLNNSEVDMELLKYFLEFAVVLKKMSLSSHKLELEKRMLTLPRSLSKCVIEFANPRQ